MSLNLRGLAASFTAQAVKEAKQAALDAAGLTR